MRSHQRHRTRDFGRSRWTAFTRDVVQQVSMSSPIPISAAKWSITTMNCAWRTAGGGIPSRAWRTCSHSPGQPLLGAARPRRGIRRRRRHAGSSSRTPGGEDRGTISAQDIDRLRQRLCEPTGRTARLDAASNCAPGGVAGRRGGLLLDERDVVPHCLRRSRPCGRRVVTHTRANFHRHHFEQSSRSSISCRSFPIRPTTVFR